jgi:hypothetical protein
MIGFCIGFILGALFGFVMCAIIMASNRGEDD